MPISLANNNLVTLINEGNDFYSNLFIAEFTGGVFDDSVAQKMSVRCKGFQPPDIETGTYPVRYVNEFIELPKPDITFNRSFSVDFRVDVSYEVYKALQNQKATLINLKNGKTLAKNTFTDTDEALFTTRIYALKNSSLSESDGFDYLKDSWIKPDGTDKKILMYEYKKCWIEDITPLEFSGSADPQTVKATINFMEYNDWKSDMAF